MEFTLEELEDIYRTYEAHGILDTPVIYKILESYTYCDLCGRLIAKSEYQNHYDQHEA